MIDSVKVIDAIENCIDKPKCRNCPWEDCERFDHETVNVPITLMRAALALIREQNARIWELLCERNGDEGK